MLSNDEARQVYESKYWRRLRRVVLAMDKSECVICRDKHKRYRKATTVHHVNHLKNNPDKALDIYYIDDKGIKQRNLLSVCKRCHEVECHPEWMIKREWVEPLTVERWD